MLLLIDNYDSFTYNLFQYLSELGEEVIVKRNNEITTNDVAEMGPERIIISPGPSTPQNAGISNDVRRSAIFHSKERGFASFRQTWVPRGTKFNVEFSPG